MIAIVWLMSTPISSAASRSWAVERIARPSRVRLDEQLERDHQANRDDDHEDAQEADLAAEEVEPVWGNDLGDVASATGPKIELDDVLQDERDADGRDQRREAGAWRSGR